MASELEPERFFKDLTEYREYWTAILSNGDLLNRGSAELMLRAVEGAESLKQAASAIQEAIKLANECVFAVWSGVFSQRGLWESVLVVK